MQKPDIRIVIGKTGSGKSEKVRQMTTEHRRVLFFDTLGHDYSDGVVFYDLAKLKDFWFHVYRSNFRIIYRPVEEVPEFEEICDLAYKCGKMTLVAEELDIFAQPNRMGHNFRNVLKRGRHQDITFIGVTQRPYGVDRIVTAMASEVYVFKTDEPRDIKYLQERLGEGIAEKLAALREYEYVKSVDHSTDFEVGKDEI